MLSTIPDSTSRRSSPQAAWLGTASRNTETLFPSRLAVTRLVSLDQHPWRASRGTFEDYRRDGGASLRDVRGS